MVSFSVDGIPAPKGSLKAFVPKGWTRPVLTSDAKGLKQWQALVRSAAIVAQVPKIAEGPVTVGMAFRLVRPDYLRKRTTLGTQPPHITRPDLDKLTRSVCDALSGVAYHDDGQVDSFRLTKRYAEPQEAPGVTVFITPTLHGD